jgi:hypothetical protein
MSSEKAPRLLMLAWKYQIKFSELVNILVDFGFKKDNLHPTSYALPEIIEAIEQHVKKQKIENKLNISVLLQKKEISDNDTRDLGKIHKVKIDPFNGLKIIGKIQLPVNDGNKDYNRNSLSKQKRNNYPNTQSKESLGLSIGVINFFDYYKNHIGIIENIVTEKNKKIAKARVFGDSLKTNRRLNKGDIVFFQLNFSNDYFHKYLASDVNIIDNISVEQIISLLNVIDQKHLVQKLINTSDSELEKISEENKLLILNKIVTVVDPKIWKLISRINSQAFIEKYVTETINFCNDELKLNYLSESNNEILFDNVIRNWTSTNSDSLSSLFNFISDKEIEVVQDTSSLIRSINNSDLNYNGLLGYTKLLKTFNLRKKLIKQFSFTSKNIQSDLQFLNDLFKLDSDDITIIKQTLKLESGSLSFSSLYSIYKELNAYALIPTYEDFISILQEKQLSFYELTDFIKSIQKDYISNEICCIIENSIKNSDKWKYDDLLDEINFQSKIGEYVVDVILNKESGFNSWKLLDIIKTKSIPNTINKYFLDKYSQQLAEYDIFQTLELAIIYNSTKAQEVSYKQITESKKYDISSENDLLLILKQIEELKIPERIKELNKPFSEFVNYLQKKNDFAINNELRGFLKHFSGATQTLVVKYLIYQYHKKNINVDKLIEILHSFNWTEISALLIVEFIKEKNYSGKILAEKLDVVFKNHFLTISSGNYNSENFLKNFQIKSIIGQCNGRKLYEGSNWQNKRWYFKNGEVTYTTNKRDNFDLDFFCEGRPWKIQDVWDSNTGKATSKKIELYWCKTRYCASRNDSIDTNKPYYSWTISEISKVMGISIEKLALAYLAGWANRMNQIVEHLFCRECNEILRPIAFAPNTLGYYAVPLFNCVNSHCSEYEKRVRFTHCMNGKCSSHLSSEPLDSRDCESCNKSDTRHTGLLCKHCGQPCPRCSGAYHPIYAEDRF